MSKLDKFIVGHDYTYEQIEGISHPANIRDYGDCIVGTSAVHQVSDDYKIDLWFILDGTMGDNYLYKLVYKK